MKYYKSILFCLVCLFIVTSSCESQSQEDSLTNLERIAYSDEYHAYQSARHEALVFAASHDIDYPAILERIDEYPQFQHAEDFDPKLFSDIPFAEERQKLQIARSLAMKVLRHRFEYLSYSKSVRASVSEIYKGLHKTYYTNEEIDAMLLHNLSLIKQ